MDKEMAKDIYSEGLSVATRLYLPHIEKLQNELDDTKQKLQDEIVKNKIAEHALIEAAIVFEGMFEEALRMGKSNAAVSLNGLAALCKAAIDGISMEAEFVKGLRIGLREEVKAPKINDKDVLK